MVHAYSDDFTYNDDAVQLKYLDIPNVLTIWYLLLQKREWPWPLIIKVKVKVIFEKKKMVENITF